MKPRRERAAQSPPGPAEKALGISTPTTGNFAHLKSAWPFALGGFLVGLLAGLVINKRNQKMGVTTRAQLRAAANTLHRLNKGALAFVLSQVRLVKANAAFRRSQPNMEQQLSDQGAPTSIWPVKWHGIVDQPPREPETIADTTSTATENLPPLTAAEPPPPGEVSRIERLRGLFAEVVLENLRRSHAPLSQVEPDPQRTTPLRAERPAEPAQTARADSVPESITPREFVPVKEPEHPPNDVTPGDLNDAIRILPSRRGQYGPR